MHRAVFATTLILLTPAICAGALSIEAAIEQRQAAFKAMKDDVKRIKDALRIKQPADIVAAASEPAAQLVSNSKSLLGTFVAGSDQGDTRAKKKIWKKWADFEARQNALISDAERLLAASATGSHADLKTAFKALAKNCKGCHRRYRQIF